MMLIAPRQTLVMRGFAQPQHVLGKEVRLFQERAGATQHNLRVAFALLQKSISAVKAPHLNTPLIVKHVRV